MFGTADLLALGTREFLALVLTAGGLGKILSRNWDSQVLDVWHLPAFAQRLLGLGLPWIELMGALSLVVAWNLRVVSFGIFLLFLMFALTVAMAVRKGVRVSCNCFGAWSREPIGPATLVTNAIYSTLAASLWVTLNVNVASGGPHGIALTEIPLQIHLVISTAIVTGIVLKQVSTTLLVTAR